MPKQPWAVFLLSILAIGAVLANAPRTMAQVREVPTSSAEIRLSFAPIVKRVAPAVVNIYATRQLSRVRSPLLDDPLFGRFFGRQFGPPSDRRLESALGSGVIVAPEGVIVTNHHVVAGAEDIKVALADRREFDCEVVLTDPRTDLAVLRIKDRDAAPFPFVEFAESGDLEVGDLVLAIGNPFGVGQTVTQGIVSALARTQVGVTDYRFFIQTDAAINPGNSGGALIDMHGRLVGINTAIYSRSGGSHGIGFAIPAAMARLVTQSAIDEGVVRRPWLGASMQNVTGDIAEGLGLDRPRGALVTRVFERSPAARSGLRSGDLIVAIDGEPVNDPDSLGFLFATRGIGGMAELDIVRGGDERQVSVALAPAPETRPRDPRTIDGSSPLSGTRVMNISPAVADELDIDHGETGVAVAEVRPGSLARRVGIQRGDIVVDVNGTRIADTRTLVQVTGRRPHIWDITLSRDGRLMRMRLRG